MHMHRNTAAARTGRMTRQLHAALAGVAMALLFLSCSLAAEPRWRQAQRIPQGANEVIGAQIGDALLVYGGQSQGGEPMGIFWMYEPNGDRWTQLPSNPVPVHHATAVGIDNKFYLFGGFVLVKEQGFNGWGPVNNAWVFDLDTRSWSALPPMPTARGALCAAAVGRKIHVLGGASIPQGSPLKGLIPPGPVQQSDANEILDVDTQTWSTGKPLPTARNHMDAAAEINGRIYAVSGVNNAGGAGPLSVVNVTEIFGD